jgi:hypothetical protein
VTQCDAIDSEMFVDLNLERNAIDCECTGGAVAVVLERDANDIDDDEESQCIIISPSLLCYLLFACVDSVCFTFVLFFLAQSARMERRKNHERRENRKQKNENKNQLVA